MNRRIRNRTYGGVGGRRGDPPPSRFHFRLRAPVDRHEGGGAELTVLGACAVAFRKLPMSSGQPFLATIPAYRRRAQGSR